MSTQMTPTQSTTMEEMIMLTKFGFYGASCYDWLLYSAKVLKNCGMDVILIDMSENKSLSYAIPDIPGVKNQVIDYMGCSFATSIPKDAEDAYDTAFIYLGDTVNPSIHFDYTFCVTDCELHSMKPRIQLWEKITALDYAPSQKMICSSESGADEIDPDEEFTTDCPHLIILGPMAESKYRYIAGQYSVDSKSCHAVDLDEGNMDCRISCQYDTVVRFSKISDSFKDLITKLCFTALGDTRDYKNFKKAFKKAERGK